MAPNPLARKASILVCDTEPIRVHGVSEAVNASDDLNFAGSASSLEKANEAIPRLRPSVILIDMDFGTEAVIGWLRRQQESGVACQAVLWVRGRMKREERERLERSGARALLRDACDSKELVTCIRSVIRGKAVRSASTANRPQQHALASLRAADSQPSIRWASSLTRFA